MANTSYSVLSRITCDFSVSVWKCSKTGCKIGIGSQQQPNWGSQAKTTLRYHLPPVRMAKMDKAGNDKFWRGCGERGTLLHCCWEWKLVQPLWKTVWRFFKTLKIELPYDPAIALLGIYPKDTDVVKRRAICTPMVIAAMSTIAKLWKEPWCPLIHEWKNKSIDR